MLVCFGFYFTEFDFKTQFFIISSMVFVSLPWPIICFTLIKRTINQGLSKKYQTSDPNTTTNNSTSKRSNANEKKLMSLCYRTFIVFAVCWTPYSVYGYVAFFGVLNNNRMDASYKYLAAIRFTVNVIAFMNSTINPITYLYTYNLLSKFYKSCKPNNGEKRKTSELVSMPPSTPATESTAMEQHTTPM